MKRFPRRLLIILLAAVFAWLQFRERTDDPPAAVAEARRPEASAPRQIGPFSVGGVRIVDIKTGRVLPIETVDLRPTFTRIANGKKNRHANDGAIFRNREQSLPRQPADYYREYVVPTPGVSGPGPQRLILGRGGEAYYTPDHYRTFIRIEKHE